MQQMDQQRHDAYAREMIKNDKLGVLYQERQERDVRELQKVNFWFKNIFYIIFLYLESKWISATASKAWASAWVGHE